MTTTVALSGLHQHEHDHGDGDPSIDNKSTVVHSNNGTESEEVLVEAPLPQPGIVSTCLKCLLQFYRSNEFLVLVAAAISLASLYPPLGAVYMLPNITASWVVIIYIFFISGLGIKTDQFSRAFQQLKFTAFVQLFNYGFDSMAVFLWSRALQNAGWLIPQLADALIMAACFPITINMVVILTRSAGGDEAAAIFNSAFSGMTSSFVSPLLILAYVGVAANVNMWSVVLQLALKVVVPVIVGQIVQKTSASARSFQQRYNKQLMRIREYCLIFIVYTSFCSTFLEGTAVSWKDVIHMIIAFFLIFAFLNVVAWNALRCAFPSEPEAVITGLFACTHKSVPIGIPLINSIYKDDPAVGLYTLPILIWQSSQLLTGTYLTPYLLRFKEQQHANLARLQEESSNAASQQDPSESTPLHRMS